MYLDVVLESDLPYLRNYRNMYPIRRWCRQMGLISEPQQYGWYQMINEDSSIEMFCIRVDDEDEGKVTLPVGVCGLTSISGLHRRAEFSLYIAPAFQRKGYAKKALKMLLKFGFDELGLNVIWGESFEGNPATKMFESLGMIHEGTRHQFYYKEGQFIDANLYSITSKEFNKRNPKLRIESSDE